MYHSTVYVEMNILNLSYTRLTYILAKADKEKQEKFKDDIEVLKKYFEGVVQHTLFQDESMIRDYQAIQKNIVYKRKAEKHTYIQ